jgi:hypothetical protein
MTAVFQTAECSTCRSLKDVRVSVGIPNLNTITDLKDIACSTCGKLGLEKWADPGLCPRCKSAFLNRGEKPILFWD